MSAILNPTPLPYGELAPSFSVVSASGQTITRSQFRGKKALVLMFFPPLSDGYSIWGKLLDDAAEYVELNAQIIDISPIMSIHDHRKEPILIFASDPEGAAWKAYSKTDGPGCGVFVLDLYGGVAEQKVAEAVSDLPSASQILEWVRGAQYRCSI